MDQPIGLQKLAALNCLEVHSTVSWRHGVKHEIRECSGELLYDAKRERRGLLSFDLTLLDVNGVEVITVHRPGTFGMCRVKIGIEGAPASIVRQKVTFLRPVFEVHDANGTPIYRIKGLRGKCTDFKVSMAQKSIEQIL